jgi:hypothetical protein
MMLGQGTPMYWIDASLRSLDLRKRFTYALAPERSGY